jgi:phage shock protein C
MADGERRLRRSKNHMIAGVCGGIAQQMGWSADRVRIGYVILSILSVAFPGILVYIVLWIMLPPPES